MPSDIDIENIILGVIERWQAGRYTERHGLITSYDPKKHLAKVTFQPEGHESGWLPLESPFSGNSQGMVSGPNPGDGKSTGDQVVVRFQEGDPEAGKIASGRVFSDQDQPPHVESGELVIWTRFNKSQSGKAGIGDDSDQTGSESDASGAQGGTGQQIYFKKDCTITFTDGNGATLVMDGNGNITINCNNLTLTVKQAITTQSATNQIDTSGVYTVVAGGDAGIKGSNVGLQATKMLGLDAGDEVIAMGGGSVNDLAVSPPSSNPSIPPWQTP